MRELELKAEQEKALLEDEKEAAHELKLAGLGKHPTSGRSSAFDPARSIRLVPPFPEKEVDKYFAHFEKVADSFELAQRNLLNRWCYSKEVGQDFKKCKQMVLLEEFKDKFRPDIRSHLDEQNVEELEKAAIMADTQNE